MNYLIEDTPTTMGIAWFSQTTWNEFKNSGVSDMDETYREWETSAWNFFLDLCRKSIDVIRVPIEYEEFFNWCKANNSELLAESRSRFVSEKLARLFNPAENTSVLNFEPQSIGHAVWALLNPFDKFKREALDLLISRKDRAKDYVAEVFECVLEGFGNGQFLESEYRPDLANLFIILGFWGGAEYHNLIIRLCESSQFLVDEILEDLATERLGCALYRTFDGDPQKLLRVYNNRLAFEWARVAAADALTRLVLEERIERESVIQNFTMKLDPRKEEPDSCIWSMTINDLGALYAIEAKDTIKAAFAYGLKEDKETYNGSFVEKCFESSPADCKQNYIKIASDFKSDLRSEFEFWNCFEPKNLPLSRVQENKKRLKLLRKARRAH